MSSFSDDQSGAVDVFWGEIAPSEHLVQFYSDDVAFLDSLEGFVAGGIKAGDAVIVIATPSHHDALEERLAAQGVDLDTAIARMEYFPLDAEITLSRFMVNGWPDEARFNQVVTDVIAAARRDGKRVRAFGEMVAVLWAQGHSGATVRLEHLWHKYCQADGLSLFCAYPKSGFTKDAEDSLGEICAAHSKVFHR
ncbi:MAG TPA: MEDS domain-containing protein [Planctomycetaceae bacterium]|nr:MEDS domain-containing protein [Planctomycetaceae bacterium]